MGCCPSFGLESASSGRLEAGHGELLIGGCVAGRNVLYNAVLYIAVVRKCGSLSHPSLVILSIMQTAECRDVAGENRFNNLTPRPKDLSFFFLSVSSVAVVKMDVIS